MLQSDDTPYTFDRVVRLLLGVGFFVGLIWLLGYLSSALVPFVSALLLAYLLNPATNFIQRLVGRRGVAVGIVLVVLLALVAGLVGVIVPIMASEFARMGKVLGDLASNAEFAQRVRAYLPEDIWEWLRTLAANPKVREIFTSDGVTQLAETMADTMLPGIKGFARGTANFLAGFLTIAVVVLYLIFLLADFGRIETRWQSYLPRKYRQSVSEFLDEFERTMGVYFRGQITIALSVGVLFSIGFAIIGLPMAFVLGMFVGILNIVPYLGTFGVIPAVLLGVLGYLEAGQSPWLGAVLALVVMGVVQAIQEVVLIPKIQGKSLGLSPWVILLALSVWGKLLGFLGLLIALPMTCLCLAYYQRMLARKEGEQTQQPSL